MDRFDIQAIKRLANGRWASLLPVLGVAGHYLTGKNMPCPICREGKDRFRFDNRDGDGTWFCNRCGPAGDGIALAQRVNGWTLAETLKRIAEHVGSAPVVETQKRPSAEAVREQMRRISRQRKPLGQLRATTMWWMSRVGHVPRCDDLWGVDRLAYQDGKDGVRSHHPGMIAVFRDAGGQPCNMHRTYLTPDGEKAAVPKPRKVMSVDLAPGGAVRLFPYVDVLGIAEGIETAVAATILTGIPCWACLNATILRAWAPPPAVRVVIFADNDPEKQGKRPGQEAAAHLAGRLLLDGRQVEIRLPETEGHDWNDVLLQRGANSCAA